MLTEFHFEICGKKVYQIKYIFLIGGWGEILTLFININKRSTSFKMTTKIYSLINLKLFVFHKNKQNLPLSVHLD